ncbi:MAG: hypothetical protein WBQ75_12635 [Acetobacteraceae bacterium]
MSRRQLTACQSGYTVVVGWDNPLSTFFAQVIRTDDEDENDPVTLWLGGLAGEVQEPEALIRPLAPYATLVDAVIEYLRADRRDLLHPG